MSRQVNNGRVCEHEQQTYKDNPCAHELRIHIVKAYVLDAHSKTRILSARLSDSSSMGMAVRYPSWWYLRTSSD